IYAAQVMRGVIEEKTNRIVEIVVSSVKPFQLMLGKIIGVGMVGLTQFLLWIVLSLSVLVAGQSVLSKDDAKKITNSRLVVSDPEAGGLTGDSPDTKAIFSLGAFKEISLPYIIGCFLFYFLAGFFLYSSIFAAIGSTADDDEETQPFMVPVLLLLGFTLLVSINVVMNNPDSSLAFWLSMIPFTAPIAMMARIPFGVPGWELLLSMTLMVASFLFMTWIAARIYRVGILMYGKKASFKELGKWLFQRRAGRK
ncbi:MAG TPA: ABC transporter permease, partial [Chitinophagaceae bacterium]|nr:ABC transporter permease [Chitinophagaceae bacterium]